MKKNFVCGELKSNKGFYVGDLCYGLTDKMYYEIWGGNGYQDGIYKDPNTGLEFAVSGTRWGDGSYYGSDEFIYGVDAGNIAVIPYELADQNNENLSCMKFYDGEEKCSIYFEDGVFNITFQSGKTLHIDTTN